MNIKIVVATHKDYRMPTDPMYIPVQGGAAIKEALSYTGDNVGENISDKNLTYCELTVLYWAWKNLEADYIGLVHYRRYFQGHWAKDRWDRIITKEEVEKCIHSSDIIVPEKRRYLIETIYGHYAHSHYPQDLAITRDVVKEICPDYLPEFDEIMRKRSAHMFNMFIMCHDILDEYCTWLFGILQEVEKRLDITEYSMFDQRVFGRLSELLLNVWLTHNNKICVKLPVVHIEGENLPEKIFKLIRRKIRPEHENDQDEFYD